ncbi:class D sortase [Bacillus sp. V2I10]|uniref:class D sortase n=1 Tax=Bacillus sp. V2I10 TaxID=3042276 RepID=UPI002780D949|nr:class D sortase [Bacillus sp. V2I10]MDQ0859434.1 sortase A [Bacillus sp. V2I10]
MFKLERRISKKRLILLFFPVFLILIGLLFTATNLYKFAAGSFPASPDFNSGEVKQKSIPEEKDPEIKKVLYPSRPELGEEMGELYIPKLKAVLPIFHGTDENELEKGVGHFAESVLPGENDNSVLSGHRDTVFKRLGEVGEGDLLIVRTAAGEFIFKVQKVRIVDEDDRTVIVPKPRATLTVSTCYPFEFIGSAPERYVLVAYLTSKTIYK